MWNQTAPAAEAVGMVACDGGWQGIWEAAVLVGAESQVSKVKRGRRQPANSLLATH